MHKKRVLLVTTPVALVFFAFFTFAGIRSSQFKHETETFPLSSDQIFALNGTLLSRFSDRYEILQSLPYDIGNRELPVGAKSAILINVSNGNILYEKNADEVIPPASMTKLFAMYVVDEEVAAGNLSYDQIIPLPAESWACNMPPHSSLMFLGEGQHVTLEELLLGLSICSGNDAAYALAYTICGNMEDFVERMNQIAVDLGLENTHFVESSGYSELNTTTAREMAAFCRVYLKKHPESLARFHSVPSFTYPKAHNLAPGDTLQSQDFSQGLPRHITMSITQENTNPLLGRLPGCDGLKTGYIDESGYNLSLTAVRNQTRFLSVTMMGQGSNAREGQAGRVADGTTLMEWAFSSFADYPYLVDVKPYFIKVYGAKEKSVNLIPAFNVESITVPNVLGETLDDNLNEVRLEVEIPPYLEGSVDLACQYGTIKIMLGEYKLDEIPLVADRNVELAGGITRIVDKMIK